MRMTWFVVVALTAGTAHADGKLYPLSGSGLPKTLRGAPAELTRVLAKSLDAEVTMAPIEDAAQLLECNLTAKPCLESIARNAKTDKLHFGSVSSINGGVAVSVTTFTLGEGSKARSFYLEGETVDALAEGLAEELAAKAKKPPKPKEPKEPKQDKQDEPVEPTEPPVANDPPPTTTDTEQEPIVRGKITTGTWGLVIGGGIGVLAGGGFLLSANSLEAQVRRQPTETRADIDRLLALEKAGKLRTQIGGALMIAGGAALAIGAVRAVIQRREVTNEKPMIDIVPERGGASVLFTVGLR
jgi:hypothetical protein